MVKGGLRLFEKVFALVLLYVNDNSYVNRLCKITKNCQPKSGKDNIKQKTTMAKKEIVSKFGERCLCEWDIFITFACQES